MSIVGSIILAGGALFGIWLGAYYAAGRLGAQLNEQALWFQHRRDEEAKRLDKQLEAEGERLAKQLDHDRRMRDLEEVRAVLDDAASAIAQSVNAILTARSTIPVLGYEVGEGFQEDDGDRKDRMQAANEAHAKTWALALEVQRLRLRFGFEHPVTASFWAARDGLVELVNEVDVDSEQWTAEQEARIEGLIGSAGKLNSTFIDACREYTAIARAV
jgi:hypothetical protein